MDTETKGSYCILPSLLGNSDSDNHVNFITQPRSAANISEQAGKLIPDCRTILDFAAARDDGGGYSNNWK